MDIKRALHFWDSGRNHLFDFAVEISDGEDTKVAELAQQRGKTASLFYGYKKAGQLWNAMLAEHPGEAELWRDHLEISYWTPLGRLWQSEKMSLGDAKEWLMICMNENYTVDRLRAELTQHHGEEIDWQKRINWLERNCVYFPALGINQKNVRRIQRAARLLQGRILAACGGTSPGSGRNRG
jgi:hypothetical protein